MKFSFLFLFVFSFSVPALSQPPASDPSSNPRKVRSEPRKAHKDWVEKDVAPIITDQERRAFLALTTDEERESFIGTFWDRRNPNPETEENEYREEYYERIAYANEHFGSGIPGWKTDRGRMYIKWGKPDSVESRPSGGAYDRPSYHGGGSTTTYPFEVWFYRHLDGVGDGIEIEFVDRTGTGEYKIARSPDEKDALANVPSPNRLDPNDPNRTADGREQDSPFARAQTISDLEKAPAIKFGDLLPMASTDSGVLDLNPLSIDVRIDFFRQSEERVIAVFTVQAENQQFVFKPVGGLQTAQINMIGRITAVSGKRSGIFEESLTTTATTEELASAQSRNLVYQKVIALPPGTYKIDVGMRDVVTGNKGVSSIGFEVPKYDEKKLSTSTLILASKLRSTDSGDIGGRFVIGSAKVIPNVTGRYKQGQEVGVYMQVYNASIDQTTLRPAVDVEYQLVRNGVIALRQSEDWSGLSDSGQRLTLARLLPTDRMPLGNYELRVVIKDKVGGGQIVENQGKFTIEK